MSFHPMSSPPFFALRRILALAAALCGASLAAQTIISGTYVGATLTGNISLANSTTATFQPALTGAPTTFTGTTAALGSNATLYWQQNATLSGKALTFGSGATIYLNATNSSLTFASDTSATGQINIYTSGSAGTAFSNQGTLTHTSGTGSIYAGNFTNAGTISASAGTLYLGYPSVGYNTTNTGTITANGTNTTVYVRGNFSNQGQLTAQNAAVLQFDGTNATGNLGNVTIASGGHARLAGILTNTALAAPTGGSFELFGGTISGGTIAAGALTFTSNSGYLDGATLNDNIVLAASTYVHLTGGATFTGATATLGNGATLYWEQSSTLTGKALTFGSGATIYLSGANNTLTLAPTSSATGEINIYGSGTTGIAFTNQGTLTQTGGSSSIYLPTFNNAGTILATAGTLYLGYPSAGYNTTNTGTVTANGTNTTVYLRGNFANQGQLTAQNGGVLQFDGTNATGNLGNVTIASGGHARLNGTLINTGLTAPTGGSFELYGGTISGGTIAAGALTFTSSSGYLSGATLNDNLVIPASTYVQLNTGATFTGANLSIGGSGGVYWDQVGTLTGKAITFGSSSFLYLTGTNHTLTLDPTTTATGEINIYSNGSSGIVFTNQGNITHTGGSSAIYLPTFNNPGNILATAGTLRLGYPSAGYNTTNSGNVTANGTNTTVYISGNFSNQGQLTAQNNAVLQFDGTNSTGNLGNVTIASGGHARLNGTLTNTALTAPSGGSFELYGGTISGGTIAAGALTFTSSSGYLSGATLNDNLMIPASAYVQLNTSATFTGASLSIGGSGGLYWDQTGTLAGKAISFGSNSFLYLTGTNHTLTLDPATTATGEINIYSNGSAGIVFTNQGTITHTGGSSSIYLPTFNNAGTILATAGTLYLGYPSAGYNTTNTGTVTANGTNTTVYLRGNVANQGQLTAQNGGVLQFDGTNATGNLGNVTIASGGHARLNGTLTNTALTAPNGGSFELYGGTISGGTVAAGALTFTSSGGYLSGATLNDNIVIPASTYVHLTNNAGFTGTTATLGSSAGLYWEQMGNLAAKAVTFGSNSFLYISGTNNTLTFDPNTTATGEINIYTNGSSGTAFTNQGTMTYTGGNGSIYAPVFTNAGAILATAGTFYLGYPSAGYNTFNTGSVTVNGTNTTVYLRGNFANSGQLTAQNSGVLLFDGTNTTGNLGNVTIASGGHARLGGTITNTALAAPAGGAFELYGGTISGGTVATGALAFTSSGGYLSGTTLNDNLVLGPSAYVRLTNNASFTGPTATLGSSAGIYWEQAGTLAGKNISFGPNSYLYIYNVNNTLTLDAASTATGEVNIYTSGSVGNAFTNQGTITHTGNGSSIYAPTFLNSGTIASTSGTLYLGYPTAGYNSTNTGTITANGTNATVYLRGNFTNSGQLTAQNSGVLLFDGTNATGNLGNVTISSGGHAYLNGTLTNTAATLATPTGGSFELYGGTITGGTVGNGALTFTSSGGYLSGVAITGNLTLPASSHVYFNSGTTFSGPAVSIGGSAGIYWQQSGTLSGKAVTIGNGGYWYVSGANNTLTLDSASSVTGDVSVYSDLSTGTNITNQGTLTHNIGSGSLYARSFTNSGTITATTGTLFLGTTSTGTSFSNTSGAAINVAGSGATVYLQAPATTQVVNQGAINVQSGTLVTSGVLTNAAGSLVSGAGIINGNVTMTGGTIAPGNSIGTLTLQNGVLGITGATVFAFEISGATSDQLVFQNPTSTINLGAGLVSLSVNLLGAPTPSTTYNFLRVSSGTNGITGTFAGLPNSGDVFTASYNGTPYTFSINYQPNLISVSSLAVPEPSTYALIGAGLLALGWQVRRRRR
jgi:hypothetical protein